MRGGTGGEEREGRKVLLQRAPRRGAGSPLRQLGENDGGEEGREMNQEKAGMGEGAAGGEPDGE